MISMNFILLGFHLLELLWFSAALQM